MFLVIIAFRNILSGSIFANVRNCFASERGRINIYFLKRLPPFFYNEILLPDARKKFTMAFLPVSNT